MRIQSHFCLPVRPAFNLQRLLSMMFALLLSSAALAQHNWDKILEQARGQTVYMTAWGGSESVNDFLYWAGQQLDKNYGIRLHHVKVTNISSVISRMTAESRARRRHGGAIDLLWINGENFRTLYSKGLLYAPFVTDLPNWRFVDAQANPGLVNDAGMPTEGAEAPWGLARLVFMYDKNHIENPPQSAAQLLRFCRTHPGRFTYPAPPDFVGTAFLEQLLTELIKDPSRLQQPTSMGDKDFKQITKPLWAFLDKLHPYLWHAGHSFPLSSSAMKPLLNDGALDIAITFNPAEATASIREGTLPASTATYTHASGTLGNTHFLAIPKNSSSRAAALVTINFLLSPGAQRRKANPELWGDPTVLSLDRLPPHERQAFLKLPHNPAGLDIEKLGPGLPEPHPSWARALKQSWLQHYQAG
ncbi:MAG: ABC transporter substrate-binding protein [Kistimonas sp.]|nr:ABC transporter substrate-binding protein [Kistimonas sp.]